MKKWTYDMGRSRRLVVVTTVLAAAGCGASTDDGTSTAARYSTSTTDMLDSDGTGGAVAAATDAPELDDQDWSKTWRLLPLPAASMNGANVVATPTGWLAVSSRGDGSKAPPPPDSAIYRSVDGTHWRAISTGAGDPKLRNAQVAYARGRYVITGSRGGANVVLHSPDGETWREQVLDDPSSWSQGPVRYVYDRFFFLTASLWASKNGQKWSLVDHPYPYTYSPLDDIAYGNGRYLGVGAGTLLSVDGEEWRSAPVDCSVSGACITTPDGAVVETGSPAVFFAEDRFYVLPSGPSEGDYSSPDGESWQLENGFNPDGYVSGHFVRLFGLEPSVWLANDGTPQSIVIIHRPSMLPTGITPEAAVRWSAPPEPDSTGDAFPNAEAMPTDLDFSWSDGLDCTQARCLVVTSGNTSQLLLVP